MTEATTFFYDNVTFNVSYTLKRIRDNNVSQVEKESVSQHDHRNEEKRPRQNEDEHFYQNEDGDVYQNDDGDEESRDVYSRSEDPSDRWNLLLQSDTRQSDDDYCDLNGVSLSSPLFEESVLTVESFLAEVSKIMSKYPKVGYTLSYDLGVAMASLLPKKSPVHWLLRNPKFFQRCRQKLQKSCKDNCVGCTPVLQLISCENGCSLKLGNSSDKCPQCEVTYKTRSDTSFQNMASGTRDMFHFSVYYFPMRPRLEAVLRGPLKNLLLNCKQI